MKITVERMMDDGVDVIKAKLPAAITVVKDINTPRLESLKGKMRAKKYEVPLWSLDDVSGDEKMVGVKNSPTRVHKTWSPTRDVSAAEIIEGEPDEAAGKLLEKIKSLGFLK